MKTVKNYTIETLRDEHGIAFYITNEKKGKKWLVRKEDINRFDETTETKQGTLTSYITTTYSCKYALVDSKLNYVKFPKYLVKELLA